jgi:hypothetical protein
VRRRTIGSNSYGLRLGCPQCGYRWLKTPGEKRKTSCPNDGSALSKVQYQTASLSAPDAMRTMASFAE